MNIRQTALAAFAALSMTGFAASADAVPISYSLDDSNAVNFTGESGAGMFTFDLPDDAFGIFEATNVMGGGGSFTTRWDTVLISVDINRIVLAIQEDTANGFRSLNRSVLSFNYGLGSFVSAAQAWGLVVNDPRSFFEGVTISEKTAAIPEPASLPLLGLGLVGLLAARRRRGAPQHGPDAKV